MRGIIEAENTGKGMIAMVGPIYHSGTGSDDNRDLSVYAPDENRGTNGTVWEGDCYHSYKAPSGEPDGGPGPAGPEGPGGSRPPKKRHLLRKVLVGVLACLVVSAGSIAGFTALINNGTIHLNTAGDTPPAFTIVKNSSSSAPAATNTTATGELSKQAVAKKVIPSVVCIQSYSASRGSLEDYFREGSSESNSGLTPTGSGSGIIASSDGYIVTNAHVVSGASSLKVILSSGKTYEAKLIGSDSVTDLALVKISATGLPAAEFGSSGDLQVADTVMAIGNPGGVEFNSTVTVGYISALNRSITNSETGYTMKCIQTDAAINPGNSGGALVNMRGQVVGINSSKIVATGFEGLGFAIPINTAQPVISELKQYGYVKNRAVLGISGQYLDALSARENGIDVTGFVVVSINSSNVSAAGIQKGDIITAIDGKTVTSQGVITSAVAAKKPGDTVTLSVARVMSGQTFTASVKLSQATGKS